jgi:hypothetical protein
LLLTFFWFAQENVPIHINATQKKIDIPVIKVKDIKRFMGFVIVNLLVLYGVKISFNCKDALNILFLLKSVVKIE